MSSQFGTAATFASNAGINERGGGDGIIRIDVPSVDFDQFANAHGIVVERPVDNPPSPGMTETIIPFNNVAEFDAIARYSLEYPKDPQEENC